MAFFSRRHDPHKAAEHQILDDLDPDQQDLDDTGQGFAGNQNFRILLAVIIVILSAFVVYWILA